MKHSILYCLILIVFVSLTACSNKEDDDKVMDTYSYEEDKTTYVLEDEKLKFTLDGDTTYFQVLNKESGMVWTSNPENASLDPMANAQNLKYLQSTLIIEYTNDTGITAIYDNFSYSIQNKLYTIEQGKDFIKVNYTIGDVKKVYVIPNAVPESRMKEFMDKMDDSSKKKINTYYRKIDINNLRATDNKGELLEKYPDLETENVYELREGTQEYLKAKIEEIFATVGYTREDYDEDEARYAKTTASEKPYFNISVLYRLEEGDLVVEMPFEHMEWKKAYPLTKVKVLPYLGAGDTSEDGFLLVPEGTGAIINFNNGKQTQNSYYTDVYGMDSAIPKDALISENRTAYPVFGISKKDNSILCIIEDYKTIASIEADVSGRNHSYNFVGVAYTTLHYTALNLSAKTDKSVIVFEAQKPSGTIKQRYEFLSTSSYVHMAKAYREYLMKKYPSLEKKEEASTPVNITLIGAIDEVKQRFGLPVSVPIPLTTYKDASEIIKELKWNGINRLSIRFRGWMNNGIKQTVATKIKPVSELGNKKKFKNLIKTAKDLNVPIYLEGMASYAYNDGIFDGLSTRKDVAKHPSREVAKLYDYSVIFYSKEEWNDPSYLLKPQLMIASMKKIAEFTKNNNVNVAYSDIGYLLNSDFNPKNLYTREMVMKEQIKVLEELKSSGVNILTNYGNDYALPYTSFITNMDLTGNRYQIIDTMVPFYTMAIHGLVDYTGNSLNLSANYEELILKSAESGAGLSFTLMKEETIILQNSNYTYLFGANYDRWKDMLLDIYKRYDAELGSCFNQYMIDHKELVSGVSLTTYEDGTKVYVNYKDTPFTYGDIVVPARDYLVERR